MPSWLSIALREPLWLSKVDPHRGGSISLEPVGLLKQQDGKIVLPGATKDTLKAAPKFEYAK